MTERQRWVQDFVRMFEAGQLSGELTVRFRDGVVVECQPSPKYKPPQAGRRASESSPK